ncbi:ASCH domain protein [Gimesia panareensis]|uniref:ASCH domain protein n=1 Tax=Gimesia panareensis TaxID=2527978 RepID=A0A518FQ66_9PLAN|nr:ASCH domain-containing protein [Gimesia panareensis]QDV18501.1 ASCH domain protein [Gimesia panareensis]
MAKQIKHPDKSLPALGIRQPWAELIMRGIKTIELRSSQTKIRGPIYVYASKTLAKTPHAIQAAEDAEIETDTLPTGVLIGTVEIVDSFPATAEHVDASGVPAALLKGKFGWKLANPRRIRSPLVPEYLPYGVWFYPYLRKQTGTRRKS